MAEESTDTIKRPGGNQSIMAFVWSVITFIIVSLMPIFLGAGPAGLLLSGVSLILLSLIGLGLAISALVKKARRRGWAVVGLLLSLAEIALGIMALISVPSYHRLLVTRACSNAKLEGISKAVRAYVDQNNGQLPENLNVLVENGTLNSCDLKYPGEDYYDDPVAYVYVCVDLATVSPIAFIACESNEFGKGGRNVLCANGSVSWMKEENFQEALKKPENAPMAEALKRGPQPLKLKNE